MSNEARGFQDHPDHQRILNCIGQADIDKTLVTAYTDDFAARPEVVDSNPLGATTRPILPTRCNNVSSALAIPPRRWTSVPARAE